MLHWSFILVLIGTVGQQSSAVNLKSMCYGRAYGTLLPNPRDCNSYYVCQSGPQLAYCNYGLHFDRVHKVCNWPDVANCKLVDVDDEEKKLQLQPNDDTSKEELQNPNELDNKLEKIVGEASHEEISEEGLIGFEKEDEHSSNERPEIGDQHSQVEHHKEDLIDTDSKEESFPAEPLKESVIDTESKEESSHAAASEEDVKDAHNKDESSHAEGSEEDVIDAHNEDESSPAEPPKESMVVTESEEESSHAEASEEDVKDAHNEDESSPAEPPKESMVVTESEEESSHAEASEEDVKGAHNEDESSPAEPPKESMVVTESEEESSHAEASEEDVKDAHNKDESSPAEPPKESMVVTESEEESSHAEASEEVVKDAHNKDESSHAEGSEEDVIDAESKEESSRAKASEEDVIDAHNEDESSPGEPPKESVLDTESKEESSSAEASEETVLDADMNSKDKLLLKEDIEKPIIDSKHNQSLPATIPSKEQALTSDSPSKVLSVAVSIPKVDIAIPSSEKINLSTPSPSTNQLNAIDTQKPVVSKQQVQVIEVPTKVLAVKVPIPKVDIAIHPSEKINIFKPSQSANQVIELSVPVFETPAVALVHPKVDPTQSEPAVDLLAQLPPQEVLTFFQNPASEIVMVPSKDDTKPSSHIVELSVPSLPDHAYAGQFVGASVEQLAPNSLDPKPSVHVIQLSGVSLPHEVATSVLAALNGGALDDDITVTRPKNPSDSKNNKNPIHIIEHHVDDDSDDLSLSSSSDEEFIGKKKKKHKLSLDSSEEFLVQKVEKVVVSKKKDKASLESQQSSEESKDSDEKSGSRESETSKDSQEQDDSSDSDDKSEESSVSSEEVFQLPGKNKLDSDESEDSRESAKKNGLKPSHHHTLGGGVSDSQSSEEDELFLRPNNNKLDSDESEDSRESAKKNGLKPSHHHTLGGGVSDSQSSEEDELFLRPNNNKLDSDESEDSRESAKKNGLKPSHHHTLGVGVSDSQSSEEDLAMHHHTHVVTIQASVDSKSSESSSEEGLPQRVSPTKVEKPTRPVEGSLKETGGFLDSQSSEEDQVKVSIDKTKASSDPRQSLEESRESDEHDASSDSLESLESNEADVDVVHQIVVSRDKIKPSLDSEESKESDEQKETPVSEKKDSEEHDASSDSLESNESESSEEDQYKPSPKSRHSSEEAMDIDEQKGSPKSKETVMQPSKIVAASKELEVASTPEEKELIPTENLLSNQSDKAEANPVHSEKASLPPFLSKFFSNEHKDSDESTEKNDLESWNPHHQPVEFLAESSGLSSSQSSEEDSASLQQASVDSESSSEVVDKPITPLIESPNKILANIGKPMAPKRDVDLRNNHFNLIVSILSVSSLKANATTNSTINRPIIGAHNTETGHPIDVMTGYSSQNVQCLHNGLYFLPHPSSCQKYFICAYRHLHLHSCGKNLTWNYKREQCELESDSRCYSSQKPAEEAINLTPMPPLRTTEIGQASISRDSMLPKCPAIRQVYLPSLDDCNKYYICIMGHAVLTSCPENMFWDARGEFCGNATDVACAGREKANK